MTKIEEVLKKHRSIMDHWGDQQWYDKDVENAMKEYAEWYAKKVLKIAAEVARLRFDGDIYQPQPVEKITNIQLPSHESSTI